MAATSTRRRFTPTADDDFPTRLAKTRAWQGLSLRELAALTNGRCTHRTIYSWEKGTVAPRLGDPLRAVAEVLRVHPGWLLNGDQGDPHASP